MENEDKGFKSIINQTITESNKIENKKEFIENLITLNKEISYLETFESFSFKEKLIIDSYDKCVIEENPDISIKYNIIIKKYGRVMIVNPNDYDTSDYIILHEFCLNKNIASKIDKIEQDFNEKQTIYVENIKKYYSTYHTFKSDIERITYELKHISPVIFFNGLTTYTNFYSLGEENLESQEINIFTMLENLTSLSIKKVDDKILIFIFTLSSIRDMGFVSKYEEVNFKQLSIEYLFEFMYKKMEDYDLEINDIILSISNVKEYILLIKIRYEIYKNKKNKLFYRKINGITLSKQEYLDKSNQDIITDTYSKKLITCVTEGSVINSVSTPNFS